MADLSPSTGEEYYRSVRNLIGKRFGRLVVISRAGSKYRKAVWRCRCDCGAEKDVLSGSLISGKTQSCGCYHSEVAAKRLFNPDISDEDRELALNRDLNPANAVWRIAVYERDSYSCVVCGDDRGGNLVAHHKDGYHWCKGKRYDVENGATSCSVCHDEFHRLYGKEMNTEEQWNEFRSQSRREKPLRTERPSVDISGMDFGYFHVVGRSGTMDDGHAAFICRCVCGNEKRIQGSLLRSGAVKSCGCKKGALISAAKRRAA